MDFENVTLSGAAYHPNFFTEEEWKRDLRTMKNAGINLVRTCELFNGWDQIEIKNNVFDFSLIDAFMDECHKLNIQVMLGTGTASPPQWLKRLEPDIAIETVNGHKYPSDATYSWACPHHPLFETYWKRYLTTLLLHYREHPALFGYQIHNEIGFPFMSQNGEVDLYCYCVHSKTAFRKWIKEKYKTIEELNSCWKWSTSNPYYDTFDDVEPPSSMPKAWSSVTRWLDFRLFMMDSITEFVRKQQELIKIYDQVHPTCLNTFIMKGEDRLGVKCAIDPFALASEVDIIGYDLYPGSSNKLERLPEFAHLFLDYARSTAVKNKGAFWMLETESGPINGWALGPHRNTNALDVLRNVVTNIGHNAKLEMYMAFHECAFQPINWGGLVDLQGNATDRLGVVKDINECIIKYHLQSHELAPRPSKVAILISRENAILANGFGHEDFLVDDIRAHYQMFLKLGYGIDFITPDQIECFSNYRIISAPFHLTCNQSLLNALEAFVMQGGILYGEPRLSYLDGKGWYQKERPAKQLQDVFGIREKSIECINDRDVICENGMSAYWHMEEIEIEKAKPYVYFENQKEAICINEYGKGIAIYGTSHFALGAMYHHNDSFINPMQKTFLNHGVQPEVLLDDNALIDVQLLEDERRIVLCIEQYTSQTDQINKPVDTKLSIMTSKKICHVMDALNQKELSFYQNGNVVSLCISLQRNHSKIIELTFVK